jgi:hypothetical protein
VNMGLPSQKSCQHGERRIPPFSGLRCMGAAKSAGAAYVCCAAHVSVAASLGGNL